MASQTFRLPPTIDRYVVHFAAEVRVVDSDGDVSVTGQLTSVTEEHVELADIPISREYVLHTFDPIHMSRGAQAEAQLRYRITNDPS
jgi:hypothetical protein